MRGFLTKEASTVSPKVTVLSNRLIIHVTNVRVSCVIVNPYWFIDRLSFCFCLVHQKPSHFMPTVSHKYFLVSAALVHLLHCPSPRLFMWPPSSFDWICLAPLVSARANLPHQHSFGLLFHPPTLEKTVCSKDCNLTTNLYGFLQGRAASL